jgi:hypothetical protein
LTAPRGITQPPTSFIGSQCQGIHHAPLNTYNTKQLKILGRIKNCIINAHKNTNPKKGRRHCMRDARNHYPQIKHHTPPPKQGNNNQPRIVSGAPPPGGAATYLRFPLRDEEIAGLLSQSPIVCLMNFLRRRSITRNPYRRHVCCAPDPHPLQADAIVTIRLVHRTPTQCGRDQVSWCSLERR